MPQKVDSADEVDAAAGRYQRRASVPARSSPRKRLSDGSDCGEVAARLQEKRCLLLKQHSDRSMTDDSMSPGGGIVGRQFNRRVVSNKEILRRGHFLSNVAEMILQPGDGTRKWSVGEELVNCGSGTGRHCSTLRAGSDGCIVVRFSKDSFIAFLDCHPGVLLSLLGTEIIV